MLAVLIPLRVLHSVYMNLGISAGGAVLLLIASLLGSYLNLPVAQLSEPRLATATQVDAFGESYVVPVLVDWPGTVVAVNIGGALIPAAVSIYLLIRRRIWGPGILAVVGVAALCHALARPVPGLGIALPALVPGVTAAIIALVLAPREAAPVAYVAGSLGVLIGADLLNLDKLQGLGAPVASIGGAGTFDGVFLAGIVAVLIASLLPLSSLGARSPRNARSI